MRKQLLALGALSMLLMGCQSGSEPFADIPITISQLMDMLEDEQDFVLLAVRDECPFCEALDVYINETSADHPDLSIYRIDTTPFDLYREGGESTTLVSDTQAGKNFLEAFPYFLYTPTFYRIVDGKAVLAGIGFDELTDTVSEWDVNSTVRFEVADQVNVWDFIAEGQ